MVKIAGCVAYSKIGDAEVAVMNVWRTHSLLMGGSQRSEEPT